MSSVSRYGGFGRDRDVSGEHFRCSLIAVECSEQPACENETECVSRLVIERWVADKNVCRPLSVTEAAAVFDISKDVLYRRLREGDFPIEPLPFGGVIRLPWLAVARLAAVGVEG